MKKIQIIYPGEKEIVPYFFEEAKAMKEKGFKIGTKQIDDVEHILFRGFSILNFDSYPKFDNLINTWDNFKKTMRLNEFYKIIKPYSIPTVFIDRLEESNIKRISKEKKWNKIFIKSPGTSLFAISDIASVWPDTSIEFMKNIYETNKIEGPFALRKFIDNPEIFYNEKRYWIMKGRPYHPSNEFPDFISEMGKKVYEFSGSQYFTMDVAGNYIVEVNPGECSDRGGEIPLDFFVNIFAQTFLY